MIDEAIFREYDIRGVVPDQINDLSVKAIAKAVAIKCRSELVDEIALGRDGRLSGDNLLQSPFKRITVLRNQCFKHRNCYKSPALFCSKKNKI